MLDKETISESLQLLIKGAKSKYEQVFHSSGEEVRGNFIIDAYERGKKIRRLCREERNIWLLEGRAFSAMLKAYASYGPDLPVRNDRIRYIGLGSGTQPEVSTITSLVTPIAWDAGAHFLAPLNIPTFNSDNTIVTWSRTFATNEISLAGTVNISEIGLFTDGIPPTYTPGTRDTTLAGAAAQRPLCYKTFEILPKTTDLTLVVKYSLRHN